MSPTTKDVILGVTPALFGLIGTFVGARVTFQATRAEQREKEDGQARAALAAVGDAIERLAWFTKMGARQPSDVDPGPGGLDESLWAAVRDARAPLANAGVAYATSSAALEPAERLALRFAQRKVLADDPADAQALVAFLITLLERGRTYRRSPRALKKLQAMEALERGRRPLEGVPEDAAPFGYVTIADINRQLEAARAAAPDPPETGGAPAA